MTYHDGMEMSQFQSTLPRGSDTARNILKIILNDFNPRSLAGATLAEYAPGRIRVISIHAPSRERPLSDYDIFSTPLISIHAPSRERR